MSRNLNINLYLRTFSIAAYGKLSKLFFYILFGCYKPCFEMKNCSKSSYICEFIFPEKQDKRFQKIFHNPRMTGGGQLPNSSLNCIFNALLTGAQYKPSNFNKLIMNFWENLFNTFSLRDLKMKKWNLYTSLLQMYKNSPKATNLNKYILYWQKLMKNMFV